MNVEIDRGAESGALAEMRLRDLLPGITLVWSALSQNVKDDITATVYRLIEHHR